MGRPFSVSQRMIIIRINAVLINIIGTMFPERKKNVKRYSETPKKVFICSPLRPHDETE